MQEFNYSVVIPTHGRREKVLQALESVWGQTYGPAEVIVVIDGDIDDTESAIARDFPATTVVILDENLGAAGARNRGIMEATSEWVAFLDDDDLWHSSKQDAFRKYIIENPGCQAVRSWFWLFREQGDRPGDAFGFSPEIVGDSREELEALSVTATTLNDLSYLDIKGDSLRYMLERNRGAMSTTMVQRKILERIPPIPDDLRRGQDWLMFIHVAAMTEWHLVPERLAYVRFHQGQITRSGSGCVPKSITRVLDDVWTRYGDAPGISIEDYAAEYRTMIAGWLWARVRRRDLGAAREVWRDARWLLPRWQDRVRAWNPPPITWRVNRLRDAVGRRLPTLSSVSRPTR